MKAEYKILGGKGLAKEKENQSEGKKLNAENPPKNMEMTKRTPYERTRAAVYATGNRWAIENFNATHN